MVTTAGNNAQNTNWCVNRDAALGQQIQLEDALKARQHGWAADSAGCRFCAEMETQTFTGLSFRNLLILLSNGTIEAAFSISL